MSVVSLDAPGYRPRARASRQGRQSFFFESIEKGRRFIVARLYAYS